jgi:hypothetical protein
MLPELGYFQQLIPIIANPSPAMSQFKTVNAAFFKSLNYFLLLMNSPWVEKLSDVRLEISIQRYI